jgi:putative endonuclease
MKRGMILRTNGTKGQRRWKGWFVYLLGCRDGSLYVGITSNLRERLNEHNVGEAAAWTRGRRPVNLVFAEAHPNKASARRREIEVKGWRREKKLALVRSPGNLVQRYE